MYLPDSILFVRINLMFRATVIRLMIMIKINHKYTKTLMVPSKFKIRKTRDFAINSLFILFRILTLNGQKAETWLCLNIEK
jgi:hypothetical protein